MPVRVEDIAADAEAAMLRVSHYWKGWDVRVADALVATWVEPCPATDIRGAALSI